MTAARRALLRREGTLPDGRSFLVRPALPEDASAFVALRDEVAAEGGLIAAVPGERTVVEEGLLLGALRSEGGLALALVIDGEVSGELLVTRPWERYRRHVGEVAIIVQKSGRGAGLGRLLMEVAIEWARAVGLARLSLAVFSSNARAIALYRSVGFSEEGLRPHHVLLPDGARDLVLMGMQV